MGKYIKHIELLKTLPRDSFDGNYIYLFDEFERGPRCIAMLYHTLGYNMNNGSNPVNMPKIEYFPGSRYTFLDHIYPGYNHFYEDVYVSNFSLPKMYKNVLTQTQPLTCKIRIKPKQGVPFKEAHELRQNFIKLSCVDMSTLPTRNDCEEYIDKCYEALTKLLDKVELIDNGYGLNPKKGSVILAEEFNNLLFNQNRIYIHHKATQYAGSYEQKQQAIRDIILHKQAMFGELQK